MNKVSIRKARKEDLPILYRFEQELVNAERPFNETLKTGTIHYYDIECMIESKEAEVVIAEVNKELVGSGFAVIREGKPYVAFEKYVMLHFMYVLPTHRGKGISQIIINALKDWASRQGIYEIRLDVYSENIAAVKAYKKVGFKSFLTTMRLDA
ncbi:GNAT family N-acetyltransferase [Olivibacter sp. SDN3]|uniref:GNAT family N-acetyltransferase n=1 Tax=Olivibacter sp. SDN3 TaxID=2764720 RepID=UPI00165120C7|nr:GNAT family N-acetyltransferase [Olivibacter sp. SDN3]QNL49014.1 GNAT family N-acetyltransferase [Olivibacter sp. SDN3]